ncbi:TolC family outer membrane protein [Solilutibacter silvestris]|uniref:Type I secretion outer membrane protein TolC n=1 Tax=Solilutibacter silvestris TaxID=1645665 RepID=A0A2K1Q0C5_9GAMM|nr:TolC family outer membrane protein [Lysobacter silvestris]PNS08489.1 type I secretion outer membrane protein TolC [Lysobacter silvestris]
MHRRSLSLALALALAPLAAHSEDLLQTYRIARTADPQLQAAEAGMRSSKEGAVQARSYLLPQVNGSASGSASRTSSPGGGYYNDPITGAPIKLGGSTTTARSANVGVSATQWLFNRGAINSFQAAKAQGKSGEYQYEAASDALITRTSQTYFNALVAMETLAAAEASETALKKQFDFASKRLEVGLAPITDVHEARAQYDAARANTIVQRNVLEDSYQALAEITGKQIRSLMALPDDFRPSIPPEGDVDAWVKRAVDTNPALQAQRYAVQAAEDNISVNRAGYLPTLSANGSFGASRSWSNNSFSGSNNATGWSHGPSVGLTLSVPIFNGGRTSSQVRQALAERDGAQDQYEQQRRSVERTTRNAYQSLVAGVSAVEARRLALVAAQSAYDASQVGLEVGTRTVIDVLINEQNLFNARQAYSQAKYSFLQSQLALKQAAGTLDVADVETVNRLLTVPAGQVPTVKDSAAATPDAQSDTSRPATSKKSKRKSRH